MLSKFGRSSNSSLYLHSCIWKNCFSTKFANSVDIQLNDKTIKLETGNLAKMADGSAVVSIDGTSVLSNVVCKAKNTFGGFLPLTVDYRHKSAASNRIPTNYFR